MGPNFGEIGQINRQTHSKYRFTQMVTYSNKILLSKNIKIILNRSICVLCQFAGKLLRILPNCLSKIEEWEETVRKGRIDEIVQVGVKKGMEYAYLIFDFDMICWFDMISLSRYQISQHNYNYCIFNSK